MLYTSSSTSVLSHIFRIFEIMKNWKLWNNDIYFFCSQYFKNAKSEIASSVVALLNLHILVKANGLILKIVGSLDDYAHRYF